MTRFLNWPRHQSVAETAAFVSWSDAHWDRWPAGPYLIRSADRHELLGSTGLTFDAADSVETGYVLARDAWGYGFATEALTAVIDVARAVGVQRLSASCHHQHQRSSRVLTKCGFACTGSVRLEFPNLEAGVLHDALSYVLVLP